MKKLLALLSSFALVATTTLSVIACGDKKIDPEREIDEVISNFKKEVNQIIQSHIEEKTQSFFLTEGEKTANFNFFNKKAIENFVGNTGIKHPNEEIRKYIINDFNNIFATSILKTKIDSLKNKEEYSIILGSVQSVFKDLVLSSNDKIEIKSKMSSSTEEKIWFGSIRVEYSIIVNYMNKNQQLEEYKVSDITSVVSLTDSEEVAGNIQTMYSEIAETFIKDDISKIYLDKLTLKNKTYLNDINSELLNYLNTNDYKLSVQNWIKNKFKVNVGINQIIDLRVNSTYRSETISLNYENKDEEQQYYNILSAIVYSNSKSIEKILSDNQIEMDNKMSNSIKNNLENISKGLSNNNEVESLISGAFKMNKITLTSLTYKISQDEYIDIPNLYLNLAQFKDKNTLTRDKLENDIRDNLILAGNTFKKTYEIQFPGSGTHTGLVQYDYFQSGLREEYILAVKNKAYTYNLDELTNLKLNSLIDRRNKFISDSKQSNFNFQVSWGEYTGKEIIQASYVQDSRLRLRFINWDFFSYLSIYTTLEFDYFKLKWTKRVKGVEHNTDIF